NGKVERGEECDDGNRVDGDGCSVACMTEPPPVCGNGKVERDEQCDDGNRIDGDGCSAACILEPAPVCGNGKVERDEQCDDGNRVDGDGCSAACMTEPPPVCGNGKVERGEGCDDGNTVNGDGCTSKCQLEVHLALPAGLRSQGLQPPGDEWRSDKINVRPSRETKELMIRANVLSVTGVVRLCIGVAGEVTEAEITKSTGYDRYDQRLVHAVRSWTYRPHRVHDRAVPACGQVVFHYEIK
ncbi:MAG TPA: TonB family protein, partial [Kofleriaceae bacterium]